MDKKNIILADCEKDELTDFANGLDKVMNKKFEINSKVCNGKRNLVYNIFRYLIYATFPIKYLLNRKQYEYIVGWQQFYALFFAFYCRIFHLKKKNILVVCNFTYKGKKGIIGNIYIKFMRYILTSEYIDYIHVPSNNYAQQCSDILGIARDKIIVTYFGIPDTYDKWKESKCEYDNFSLAIGRSNRDYDFLIDAWKQMPKENKLLIVSDEYKTNEKLPKNIILRNDINGDKQFPYIINCNLMIIPIADGDICSGDTVLLKAMSFYKTVVVTEPSTLSEMYIENGKNGIAVRKEKKTFIECINKILKSEEKKLNISRMARKSYLEKFSRYSMGKCIAEHIKN